MLKQNSSGKVLTVFVIIILILSITLTALVLFLLQQESKNRRYVEEQLDEAVKNEKTVSSELKELKKQAFLLEEKNKEADERINSLLDELELEEGLKEEMKTETTSLKEQIATLKSKNKGLEEQLSQVKDSSDKITSLEEKLKKESERVKEYEAEIKRLTEQKGVLESQVGAAGSKNVSSASDNVKLDPIVVSTDNDTGESIPPVATISGGRILSVDTDTDFVIINLGRKDGIVEGLMMSVYRGQEYLGDVTVTRVQPEMAAADFIPPFSSRTVRKNDQVVVKE